MVCETFPSLLGQQFALDLAHSNIKTTLIHDAAAFTVMPRCNKVVIGCHAVLANGGILVPSGGFNLVMAAAQFKVPVIVVTGMYKVGRSARRASVAVPAVLRGSGNDQRHGVAQPRHAVQSVRSGAAERGCAEPRVRLHPSGVYHAHSHHEGRLCPLVHFPFDAGVLLER